MTGGKCPKCGRGSIGPQKGGNRTAAFKHIPDLPIPEELAIPACTECGTRFIDRKTAVLIDEALATAYRAAVYEKSKDAIQRLSVSFRKLELEALLGLSSGYLSKLVGENNQPSPQIAACLMLLANDPGRIDELRSSWRIAAGEIRGARHASTARFEAPQSNRTEALVVDVEPQVVAA